MEWGKNYDMKLCSTHLPLDIQKTTDLHRKCAHHLRGHFLSGSYVMDTPLIYDFFFKFTGGTWFYLSGRIIQ